MCFFECESIYRVVCVCIYSWTVSFMYIIVKRDIWDNALLFIARSDRLVEGTCTLLLSDIEMPLEFFPQIQLLYLIFMKCRLYTFAFFLSCGKLTLTILITGFLFWWHKKSGLENFIFYNIEGQEVYIQGRNVYCSLGLTPFFSRAFISKH